MLVGAKELAPSFDPFFCCCYLQKGGELQAFCFLFFLCCCFLAPFFLIPFFSFSYLVAIDYKGSPCFLFGCFYCLQMTQAPSFFFSFFFVDFVCKRHGTWNSQFVFFSFFVNVFELPIPFFVFVVSIRPRSFDLIKFSLIITIIISFFLWCKGVTYSFKIYLFCAYQACSQKQIGMESNEETSIFHTSPCKKCDSIYICLLLYTMDTQQKCGNYGLDYHMELE